MVVMAGKIFVVGRSVFSSRDRSSATAYIS